MEESSVLDGSKTGKAPVPKDLTADDVTEAYRSIAKHAAVVSGTIFSVPHCDVQSAFNVMVRCSQRDIDRKEKTVFTNTYCVQLTKDGEAKLMYVSSSLPQEVNNVMWDVLSPSEKKRVVIVKQKDKKGEDKQFIEIWNMKQKEKVIDIKAFDKHGDIVGNDGQFGSVRWSQCENYLLYVAEKKKPKTASFFQTGPPKDEDKDEGDTTEVTLKGGEYLHRESWGEQLVERHETVICRLNITNNTLTLLSQVPDQYTLGQAQWGPGNEVIFVGWCHEPFRLGLRFCVERTSFVFKASFDGGEYETLSEKGRAVRCPNLSPDLSRLVYLDTADGGAHNQCSRLVMIDLKKWASCENKEEAREVIVDIVDSPYKNGYDPGQEEFPGIFTWADLGSVRSWMSDGVHVLLNSFFRSRSSVIIVNTNTKDVRTLYPFDSYPFRKVPVPPAKHLPFVMDKPSSQPSASKNDGCAWACSVLDVRGTEVLMNCSWPNTPPFPVLAHLNPNPSEKSQWIHLGGHQDTLAVDRRYDWKLFVLDPKGIQAAHSVYDYLDFEAILYLPVKDEKDETKPPLILFPHGGPHSAFDCSFTLNPAVFACCGFAVLCVNYRGSLGFGQDNISSLLGNIGNFDVKDCMLAMQKVRSANLVDPKNTFVYGGSHGGFLSAHLIGQYPDEFRAASMRNPVVNLTSMVGTSDIPDWVFTEAGLQFEYSSQAKGDLLTKLWNASPVSYIDNVKTPVMLHIGLKDLRVPPSQGLEYYKMLKARGVPVQYFTYPDSNHSLAEVEVEADSLVNSILWFAKHISSA